MHEARSEQSTTRTQRLDERSRLSGAPSFQLLTSQVGSFHLRVECNGTYPRIVAVAPRQGTLVSEGPRDHEVILPLRNTTLLCT
jgi:hypothetical protein